VISGERGALEGLLSDALPVLIIGEVGSDAIEIEAAERSLSIPVTAAEAAWLSLGERAENEPGETLDHIPSP
jgi:hypothetical protein